MNWTIENGIIKLNLNNKVIEPSAKDIFLADDKISVNNVIYPFQLEGITFSKMVSLEYKISFIFSDCLIFIIVYVEKDNKKYNLILENDRYVDYLIIENVWKYINPTINIVSDILNSLNINADKEITYIEYIKIKKMFDNNSISYIDEVANNVETIKNIGGNYNNNKFNGKLYHYQESGVRWLNYMIDGNCGCILADSMGLGKTVQIILAIANIKEKNNKCNVLVISPISLLENWKREIEKFYPSLNAIINHGNNRQSYYKELLKYDVIITSYGCVQTDLSMYQMIKWDAVILDEAQNIKNPNAKRTKAIKTIDKKVGIAVTGTPFENHLTDIWSISDFVIPNYFGPLSTFENYYHDNEFSASSIEPSLSPIMLRRKIDEVAKDLPKKIEISQPILMFRDEAILYDKNLREIDELKNIRIDKIQKLRMFCTHPIVYDDTYINIDPIEISTKYQRCCEIIEEIFANKEKVIIFTSFNEMINILVNDVHNRFNVPTDYINGSTPAELRQKKIDDFSSIKGSAAMVLNTKAAGTGLNITAANHVIHYNLEWNPSVEDQATARAYRRGQNKTVFVHRLYYANTVEEIMNERIERKRKIGSIAVVGNEGEINSKDLERALKITPMIGYENEI